MNRTSRSRCGLALLAVVVSLLAGCAAKNPAAPATPPQVQVAKASELIGDLLNTATSGLIEARRQNLISEADLQVSFKVVLAIGHAVKDVNAELVSADSWDVQKTKMLGIVSAAGLPYLSAQLPPNPRALLVAVITTWNAIAVGVGGPTI